MNIDKDTGRLVVFRDIGPDEPPPPLAGNEAWIDHWRSREMAERRAAKKAQSDEARRAHQELAQAYVERLEQARNELTARR